MQFLLAKSFTDGLAKLTSEEQKAVKTTAFDLQLNLSGTGLSFHRLDGAKEKNFWSVRVNRDIRLIVHRTDSTLLIAYVGHHDDACNWAKRRCIERHPKTGAAQLVELHESVREIQVPRQVFQEAAHAYQANKPVLPPNISDDEFLGYGVPEVWLADVRNADEDSLLEIAGHLPEESAEALLQLVTGVRPEKSAQLSADEDPFAHPDALQRFRLVENQEELERALEYPWEKWIVFLHPTQRRLVESEYAGPARVAGSAGTGKTIVALHRAAHLARAHPDARVLLATFSDALASALHDRLGRLIHKQPRMGERLEVYSMRAVGRRLYEANFGELALATEAEIQRLIQQASEAVGESKFSSRFLWDEWSKVVDAWQLDSWEAYRDVMRLGRKTRLPESQRKSLWSIFSKVRDSLVERQLLTEADMCRCLESHFTAAEFSPFDYCIIDEAQDIAVAELRLLAALGGDRVNALFFAGDLGQRIYRTPFSWSELGVKVKGRSHTLRLNYRTSHQIRRQADRLLPPKLADVDGVEESRAGTVSAFNGPEPRIRILKSVEDEIAAVSEWLSERGEEGYAPHELAVLVRSDAETERAKAAVQRSGMYGIVLSHNTVGVPGKVTISSMHRAKGLEFRAVAVAACDDDVLPLQSRIENVSDEADLEDTYSTERHLLYVACTRARDHLFVTGVEPASEFLDDLRMED